jgi:hypothetical protein
MNSGVAQPFWLDPQQVNPRPWRRGFVNAAKALGLDDSGAGPGSGRENRQRIEQARRHWAAGLEKLHQAVQQAPPAVRSRAEANWRTARAFGNNLESTCRLMAWFDARDRWLNASAPTDRQAAAAELARIGREELSAVQAELPMYLCDSRLGHLNHGRGCYTALSILAKTEALEQMLEKGIGERP